MTVAELVRYNISL